MNNVVLVFGVPGVGKTTLIKQSLTALAELGYARVSGGSLINENISEQERDSLRKLNEAEVLLNQKLLLKGYTNFRKKNPKSKIIFDGHCLVKNKEMITTVPLEIIQGLNPNKIIFLDEEPEIIRQRRRDDSERPEREEETVSQLEELRLLQKSICAKYGHELKIPFLILQSPSLEDFTKQILE